MSGSAGPINISTQKAGLQAQYAALLKGLTDELVAVDSFVFRKVTYTRAQPLAELQSVVDAATPRERRGPRSRLPSRRCAPFLRTSLPSAPA